MSCQRSKQKILESARELFYHVGYQTTSVDDILKRCGVARSNFYYHFKSKEELACAVIAVQVEEFEALLLASLHNPDLDPERRLSEFCACLCRMQSQQQQQGVCPFGNLAGALSSREDEQTELFRGRLRLLFQQTEAALQACLVEGMQQGRFRTDVAPADLAAMLLATVEGLLILTKTYRDRAPLVNGLAAMQRLLRP
jgi:TetR/AcrR family transcriptional repressor of nem operon